MKTKVVNTSLEDWLKAQVDKGIADFAFHAVPDDDGIVITIHPNGQDGDTLDFLVEGDCCKCVTEVVDDSTEAFEVDPSEVESIDPESFAVNPLEGDKPFAER